MPLLVTSTVATTPTVVPASGLPCMPQLAIAIPCPMPLGRLLPQPDLSATSRSTLAQPGSGQFASSFSRYSSGSMPAASAHSSMKGLHHEGVGIIARPAIGAGDDMEWQQSGIDQDIGDAAERIGAFGQHGEMPLGGLVGDEHSRHACLVEPGAQLSRHQRAILALTRLLLARPDRMDRSAGKFLRYGDDHPQIVGEDPPSEGATNEGLMEENLGRVHSGLVSGDPEGLLRLLRRMPDLD